MKEKWKKLLLREKILIVSGILVILSIPLSLVSTFSMAFSMTCWTVSVFYNFYKFTKRLGEVIDEKRIADNQEKASIEMLLKDAAVFLTVSIGIPVIGMLILYLWTACN